MWYIITIPNNTASQEDYKMTYNFTLKGQTHTTTVQGITFSYFSDFGYRGTFAINEATGETKQISSQGYIHKDLTVRKAIAASFGLSSFRK